MSRTRISALFVGLVVLATPVAAQKIEFEAEDFVDSFGNVWEVFDPPFDAPVQQHAQIAKEIDGKADYTIEEASGDAFVGIPNGVGDKQNVPGGGWLKYEFNVPKQANWYLWGRAIAPTAGDNSCYWARDADDGDADSNDDNVNNIWDMFENAGFVNDLTSDWHWFLINSRTGPFAGNENEQTGPNPKPLNIRAGTHTLHIVHREDGLFFDWFMATTDKGLDPNRDGSTVRAVSSVGRLATMWGDIKNGR